MCRLVIRGRMETHTGAKHISLSLLIKAVTRVSNTQCCLIFFARWSTMAVLDFLVDCFFTELWHCSAVHVLEIQAKAQ